ncbi:MAG: alginate lyase family protein [Sphingobium sp.]
MTVRRLLPYFAALMIGSLTSSATGASTVVPPYLPLQTDQARKQDGPVPRCPAPVPAMVDMSGISTFYVPDRTKSTVDPEMMRAYVARTRDYQKMKTALISLQRDWVGHPDERSEISDCIRKTLIDWAGQGALLGSLENNQGYGRRQASLIIIWSAPAISIAYHLADRDGGLDARDKALLQQWIGDLDSAMRAKFRLNAVGDKPAERPTNQTAWAAAAGMYFASVTGNAEELRWSFAELQRILQSAEEDGSLPSETKRGKKALAYQNFALIPIALLLNGAIANDMSLSAEDEKALLRIISFTARAWTHSGELAERTGSEQLRKPENLIWIDLLLPYVRARDAELANQLDRIASPYRPFDGTFWGFDT